MSRTPADAVPSGLLQKMGMRSGVRSAGVVAVALITFLGACEQTTDDPTTTTTAPDPPDTTSSTTTAVPGETTTTLDVVEGEWLVGPLAGMLIDRSAYGDAMFLNYVDFLHGMNFRGEREALAALADVTYPPPPELSRSDFPAPCVTDWDLVEVEAQYIGQQIRSSDPSPAWITAQAVATTESPEIAAEAIAAIEDCAEERTLGPIVSSPADDAWAEALIDAGADEAVTASADAGGLFVRAVTVRVGPALGYLAMQGHELQVPDVDVIEVLASDLLSRMTTNVRFVEGDPGQVEEPLAGFRVQVHSGNSVLSIGDGDPDEVLFEAPPGMSVTSARPAPDEETLAFTWYDSSVDWESHDRQETLSIRQPDGDIVDIVTTEQVETSLRTRWADLGYLSWNSDGAWLAFEWEEPSTWGEVWAVRPDGSDLHLATPPSSQDWTDGDEEPTWGPDPNVIYFQSARTRSGSIWRIAMDGSEMAQVTPELEDSQISNATVSPDGRWMVAVNLRNVPIVVDLENDDHQVLESVPEIDNSFYALPQWSPDGRQVIYALAGGGTGEATRQALVIDPATGSLVRIGVPPGRGGTFVWNDDGTKLLTSLQARFNDMEGLAVIDVSSGEITPVRQDLGTVTLIQPTWPPTRGG